jgi:hypothetical protein
MRRRFLAELKGEADRVMRAETNDGRTFLTTEKPAGLGGPRQLITESISDGRGWR